MILGRRIILQIFFIRVFQNLLKLIDTNASMTILNRTFLH